jgi:hypothetical protein
MFAPSVKITGVDNYDITPIIIGAIADVGVHTATTEIGKAIDKQNYYIEPGDESVEFEITPAQANVVWNYTSPYTYNGLAQKPSATVTGIGGNVLNVNIEYKQSDNMTDSSSVNAGDYTAIITLNDTNYSLSNNRLAYTINKRDLTITASNLTVDYTGNSFEDSFTYDQSGLVNGELLGEVVEIVFNGEAIGATEAGTYTIELSKTVINDQNYNVILVNGTLTINQVVSEPNQE